MNNKETIRAILQNVNPHEIEMAMKEFAEDFGESKYAFHCGYEYICTCGRNCGANDDCFACGDIENLGSIRFNDSED